MALLVLDEQFANPRLVLALRDRGIDAATVSDYGVTGQSDPDVVRRLDEGIQPESWVLVTMDLTIMDDHEGFSWERYAIAWIVLPEGLKGLRVEQAKSEIVHRHAHLICDQKVGDHCTYTRRQRFRSPPALTSLLRRAR